MQLRNTRTLTRSLRALVLGCMALGLGASWGCSSGSHSDSGEESAVGAAQFAVKVVPSDVQCIQITAAGSRTVNASFDVKPNQAAQLSMPGLPAGTVTFTANAYPLPCNQVTSTSVASWNSAAVSTQVIAGGVIQVTLVMSQTGSATIGIEFGGNAGAGGGSGAGGGGAGGSGGAGIAGSGGSAGPLPGIWNSSNWDNALWQ